MFAFLGLVAAVFGLFWIEPSPSGSVFWVMLVLTLICAHLTMAHYAPRRYTPKTTY